jgi:hypothetical protein
MTGTLFDNEGWSSAIISDDGLYRYHLSRRWAAGGQCMVWIMLNPSTADADIDDPTIRRCIGFAKREGYNAIEVLNCYALRCTRPTHLLDHPDPEGPDNLLAWQSVLDLPNRDVVAAWGASWLRLDGLPTSRALEHFEHREHEWGCLGYTDSAMPLHPLYVPKNAPFVRHH